MRIAETDEIVLKGIGVSPGIAVGPIVLDSDVFEEPVDGECEDPDAEWQRFTEGVETTRRQLIAIRDKVAVEAGTDDAFIFDAHLLMLEDSTLLRQVEVGRKKFRQHYSEEEVQSFADVSMS